MDIWLVFGIREFGSLTEHDRQVKRSVDRNTLRGGDRNSSDVGTSLERPRQRKKEEVLERLRELSI